MSNCIQPSGDFKEGIALDSSHFLGLKEVRDTDGNKIVIENGEFIFYMAPCTTHREFRNFLLTHIQPFVIMDNLRMPVLYRDEYDGFEVEYSGEVKFQPPGTAWYPGINEKIW